MTHHLDREFATPDFYQYAKTARREMQSGAVTLDRRHGLTHVSAPRHIVKFWDAGEGELFLDPGDGPQLEEPTPTWHYRGRK